MSAAATKARTARPTVNRTVAAYTAPTAPASITSAAIAKGQSKRLSPTHPIPTVQEA